MFYPAPAIDLQIPEHFHLVKLLQWGAIAADQKDKSRERRLKKLGGLTKSLHHWLTSSLDDHLHPIE